ncbi:hypothetical protein ACOKFD_08870 [Flagellimonas sp. S174]|uniref:hypothetical protein n=1 Tax=Flagellimonas sp. S174 TaxID=3410790 RepID=UPI003BF511CE
MRKLPNLKTIVLVLSIFVLAGCEKQKETRFQEWQLVYENDATGNAVNGSLDELVQSVKKGKPIRISWEMGNYENGTGVHHTAEVKFSTIMKDSVVFAQIEPIIAQVPDLEENTIAFYSTVRWCMLASTNGINETLMYEVIDHKTLQQKRNQWGIKWFSR